VVLVGLMGAGKTTVGRLLATLLRRPYIDNDELVQAATGHTAKELAHDVGADALHRIEAVALHEGLQRDEPSVISAAAATVLDQSTRDALEPEAVVWLTAPPEILASRAEGGAHRPFLAGDAVGALAEMAEARDPLFRSVADVVVEVGDHTPEELAEHIADALPPEDSR
jgi:shikimate kinase